MRLVISLTLALLLLPALVGSAAASVTAAPPAASFTPLFPTVPEGGYPDAFPFGQCTWWVAYNHRVSWGGDAKDWLRNARAAGAATSDLPTIGVIAVFEPGGAYNQLGHVAIVIATAPGSYTVSEMNALGWGRVSTRVIAWPDPHVQGFVG